MEDMAKENCCSDGRRKNLREGKGKGRKRPTELGRVRVGGNRGTLQGKVGVGGVDEGAS